MNKKQKIKIFVGTTAIVASPFLGLAIAPLLHRVTCQPDIPGRFQLFQCYAGDFFTWVITGSIMLILGLALIMSAQPAKKAGKVGKSKPLFIIQWTKQLKTPVTKKAVKYSVVTLVIAGIITGIGIMLNVIPFAYAMARCGQLPIESSRFMADYSYRLPGDEGYGLNVFSEYRFCTQEEIVATNGYHRNVNTDAAKAEAEANRLKREEEGRFEPAKVDYQVFLVKMEGFEVTDLRLSEMSSNDLQTFFNLKKPGTKIGFNVREGKIPSTYELCRHKEYKCEEIGHDTHGNVIRKQTTNHVKRPIIYYSVNIGETFINIGQGGSTYYSDSEMIGVFNSLIPYSE
jgi:hypothetical protein